MIKDILKNIFESLYKIKTIKYEDFKKIAENANVNDILAIIFLFSFLSSTVIYLVFYFSEFFSYLGPIIHSIPGVFILYSVKTNPVLSYFYLLAAVFASLMFNIAINSLILYLIPFLKRRTEFKEFLRFISIYYPVFFFLTSITIPTLIGPPLVLILYLYVIYKYLVNYSKLEAIGSIALLLAFIIIFSKL